MSSDKTDKVDKIVIKELDAIVAIQILKDTYTIDVYSFDSAKIDEIIKLLEIAKTSKDIQNDTTT